MINKEEIVEKMIHFMVNEYEVDADTIQPEANLKDTLGLDSLDYVDLGVSIDSNFGIKLVDTDFVGIDTFQSFYNLIENKLKLKHG